MSPVRTVAEVFDAIQQAKTGASDFRTNFFPVQSKLQSWIDQGELTGTRQNGATFFFKKDRDFLHFYFCAADLPVLQRELPRLDELKSQAIVTDVVGNGPALEEMLAALRSSGFRNYARLQRMMRPASQFEAPPADTGLEVTYAGPSDSRPILDLIESAFDRYGEQLPSLNEINSAVGARQILMIKRNEAVAGLLFFETQGVSSSVRFWVVAEKFRALRVGSALMQHYLNLHQVVRRFTLWVNTANDSAIRKYEHFGYKPDGLMDYILANSLIPS
jgi:ribosomal protein S18 acetylase RimI-like enzyme